MDWQGVVELCGHLDALIWHRLIFSFGAMWENYVSVDKIRDLKDLKGRIQETAERVTRDMLQSVWQEEEYRLDIRSVTNGARVESC
jgi:hypothetical protein